ncbi:MAG: TRAP transporter large permease subunit [Ideonella sp.]|nr:TRAP transporter large permease subunit [Ideonella sp.]
MNELLVTGLLILCLLTLLVGGVWIGLALSGVAWLGLQLFTDRPAGEIMTFAIWDTASSWALTALPLFIWMGEILVRTSLPRDTLRGVAPWLDLLPGRLLHVNVVGATLFAALSSSSAATSTSIGKRTLPELAKRGYPDAAAANSLAGAGTLGLLIPPSLIMVVYALAADVPVDQLFAAGLLPGLLVAGLTMAYLIVWSVLNADLMPRHESRSSLGDKVAALLDLFPVLLLIAIVLGSLYTGWARPAEAAALGVLGALLVAAALGSLTWANFRDALLSATRLYCMLALLVAGAAFLAMALAEVGVPQLLVQWVNSLHLHSFVLLLILMLFYLALGSVLDGVSAVLLTMGLVMPVVRAAGIDPLWFGVFLILVVEMAQITPPAGFNLFMLQALTGRPMSWVVRTTGPMLFLLVLVAGLLYAFPVIVTWLPEQMMAARS